jgi:DNA-binding Lrp family transcriptional regulator
MTEAFILINVALGHEEEIINLLKKIDGINMVNGVFGAYDVVIKLQAEDSLNMRSIITDKIRKIDNIRSTLALMIIDEQSDTSDQ